MCHWICQGIGIRTNDLYEYLDEDKCIKFIKKQVPGIEIKKESFDIDDYFYGEPFENLADLLCFCDNTDTLTYGDDNDGNYFFYYQPSYPWSRTENEPSTKEEVYTRIMDAVQKITNLQRYEIRELIDDDIYEYGCG